MNGLAVSSILVNAVADTANEVGHRLDFLSLSLSYLAPFLSFFVVLFCHLAAIDSQEETCDIDGAR